MKSYFSVDLRQNDRTTLLPYVDLSWKITAISTLRAATQLSLAPEFKLHLAVLFVCQPDIITIPCNAGHPINSRVPSFLLLPPGVLMARMFRILQYILSFIWGCSEITESMGNGPIHLLNIRKNLYSRLGLRLGLNHSFSGPYKRKEKFVLHLHSCLESRLCWLFNAVFYPLCIPFMFLVFYFIGFSYIYISPLRWEWTLGLSVLCVA